MNIKPVNINFVRKIFTKDKKRGYYGKQLKQKRNILNRVQGITKTDG